ncbi:TIGR04283 family arsenosugar biosynthesis glycosyltransferase [Ferrimicrobium sp.]|uniref:TIGR04283 family arsenosugar biosynthesis glycosyltransferase n=1 Tax=Ferrimicrobium sp. TaxID=2926050 RepID=UPI00263330FB|nr:TIGR04283 family arsenosugar biosynthesis glycosyltransferase [Ferrimicrobium sp.]
MSVCDVQGAERRSSPVISIIIPTLNEEKTIGALLNHLHQICLGTELIVVDGGSTDSTTTIAAQKARVLSSAPGRAHQMNCGAQASSAPVLWFIHADCWIDPNALDQLREALSHPDIIGGGLTLQFDYHTRGLDYLAWSSTRRARYLHQIFGDQALFVRRSVFEQLGGFPELPIMEDLEFSRRLTRQGRLVVLPAVSIASSRRFLEHGTWSMIVFMQLLKACYFLGVQPANIARWYQRGPFWTLLIPTKKRSRKVTQPALGIDIQERNDHRQDNFGRTAIEENRDREQPTTERAEPVRRDQ